MLRFDEYPSEEKAYMPLLFKAIQGNESRIVDLFLELGPNGLRTLLRLKRDVDWALFFHFLVFQHKLLQRCVQKFPDFFQSLVEVKGPLAIRKILGIESSLYDEVFQEIFEAVAIDSGALSLYFRNQLPRFLSLVQAGKGDEVRKELGLGHKKYQKLWRYFLGEIFQRFRERLDLERFLEQELMLVMWNIHLNRKHQSP